MESINGSDHQLMGEYSSEYLPVFWASFILFLVLMYVGSPLLSAKFVPTYNKLNNFDKADWNTRMVSNVHAVIVSVLSVYLVVTDDAISADKVWGTSLLSRVNVCIICGFLVADLLCMLNWFTWHESRLYILHHFFVLYPFLNNVVYGPLTFFANFRITTECSTLFVNIRWFMSVLDYKSSKWYIVNGLVMAAVFFLCRIAFVPLYYAMVYQDVSRAFASLPLAFIVAWLPSGVAMDALNMYWFRKICKGAAKTLLGQKKQTGVVIRNRVKGE